MLKGPTMGENTTCIHVVYATCTLYIFDHSNVLSCKAIHLAMLCMSMAILHMNNVSL